MKKHAFGPVAPGLYQTVQPGDIMVTNPKTGKAVPVKPLKGTPKEIFDGGGILPLLKKLIEEATANP